MSKRKRGSTWMPEELPADIADGSPPPSAVSGRVARPGHQLASNDEGSSAQFMEARRATWMKDMAEHAAEHQPDAGASSSSSWPALGQPLPSAAALDNPELLAAHSYRNSPAPSGGQVSCTLDPQRLTQMICGRPTGLLVLSHQFAPAYEFDSYLADRLCPLQPVFAMGPTGKLGDTAGSAAYAIFHNWCAYHREGNTPFFFTQKMKTNNPTNLFGQRSQTQTNCIKQPQLNKKNTL
jgi:hypothetical protein